jgi:DnaJ like chaperone protein
MPSISKFLGATLGWTFAGPIGGILGFLVGSFVDEFALKEPEELQGSKGTADTSSGDFEISLLVLAAIVIKADGNVNQRELHYVRNTFIGMYGKERAARSFKIFKGIIQNDKVSTQQVCMQINQHMNHASRLQLLHFLFNVARADGQVGEAEMQKIHTISGYLNINSSDFHSIRAMFYKEVDSAYKILEIEKSASHEDVKMAYRKMVKKYHPDKLRGLGAEHVKGAEEKFRQVQKAYEQIQKERGI